MYERDGRTDKHTNGRTPHGAYRAAITLGYFATSAILIRGQSRGGGAVQRRAHAPAFLTHVAKSATNFLLIKWPLTATFHTKI